MRAATEEVNKTLENAGQKVSSEDSHIYLNQMQLNDMPVLGMLTVLYFFPWVLLTAIVSIYYAPTCSRHHAKYFVCVAVFDPHNNPMTRNCYYSYLTTEEMDT